MSRPSVLIFDLDGTLIDSMGALGDVFSDLLAEYSDVPRDFSRQVYFSLAGRGPESQFREVLRRAGADDAAAHQLATLFWQRTEVISAPPFAEVHSVLQSLQSQAYDMYVSSGGQPDLVLARAGRAGIAGYFRLILGTDEHDPDMAKGPPHFRLIADSLGIPAPELSSRAWMIGDGPFDMKVAHEAGIKAIGRMTGDNAAILRESGASTLIDDLTDLLRLLGQEEIPLSLLREG